MRTRIKICGLTCLEDAKAAVDLGVDALGFIFAEESPRRLTPEKGAKIINSLPSFIMRFGVFKDQPTEWIREVAHFCKLHIIQLHGEESPEYCRGLGLDFVKAFRVKDEKSLEVLPLYYKHGQVRPILLDTFMPDKAGGTGVTFDWKLVHLASRFGPIILSGGLNPENIKQAIIEIRPFAVDTSSGVEISPGKKDINKLKRFIKQVYIANTIVNNNTQEKKLYLNRIGGF